MEYVSCTWGANRAEEDNVGQRSLLRKNHHAREIGTIDIDYSMGVLSRLSGKKSLLMVMDVWQMRDFNEFEGVFGSLQRGRSPYDGDHGS